MNVFASAEIRVSLLLLWVAAFLAAIPAPLRAETCRLPSAGGTSKMMSPTTAGAAADSDTVNRVYVFFDGSGSMAGYASPRLPSTAQGRAYVDLATGLSSSLALGFGAEVRSHRFGREFHPLSNSEISKLGQEKSYLCQGCDIQESRIDKVLDQAARGNAEALYVIVTDLFLTEQDLVGSGPAALHAPVTAILRGGRSIGLLGIKSGFHGTIHDLPSGKTYQLAKERPFYVLFVGTASAILRFRHQLETDYLRDLPADSYRFVLFTTQVVQRPIEGAAWPRDAFQLGDGGEPAALLRSDQSEGLQQFRLDGQFTPPRAAIQISDRLTPFTVAPSAFEFRQQVWLYRDASSSSPCGSWLPQGERSPLLAIRPDNGTIALQFATPAALRGLRPHQTHLFRFEVLVTKVGFDAATMGWLRDWSFEAADEVALVAKKPPFFPTLNLLRLSRTMATIVQDEFQPKPLLRFGLLAQYR